MDTYSLKYTKFNDDGDESHLLALGLMSSIGRVLEVGAATGYVNAALTAMGHAVVSVDIDAEAAAVAASRGVCVRVGAIDDVVGSDERFDFVMLLDVIEHVADPDTLLRSCLARLRPDGHVIVSVPNVAHWSLRWSLMRGRFDYTSTGLLDETHVRLYTAKSLMDLLARHGLRVVQRRTSLGISSYRGFQSSRFKWRQRQILRRAAAAWPTLFGYQFVWLASRQISG